MKAREGASAEYIRAAIAAYAGSRGTLGRVRPADRRLAARLYERGIALETVEAALLLATARRRAAGAGGEPVRSLHYFLPVIEELLRQPLPPGYADYLRQRLAAAGEPQGPPHAGPKNDGS